MKRILLAMLIVIVSVVPSYAATITTTTTPEQDAALIVLLKKVNVERAAMTPPQPAYTAKQYVDYLLAQWLDGVVSQGKTHSETTVRDAWQKADDATKAKVKADLGVQ